MICLSICYWWIGAAEALLSKGQWPSMPIVELWDLWYRQIRTTAQLVNRMSCGVPWGLRDLSNAGDDSPAAEQQRSTPLESSPAVSTAPHASPATESSQEFYKSVWDRPLRALGASESSAKPAKPPRLRAPPPAQDTSTTSSKVVPKSLFHSAPEGAKALATEFAAGSKDGDEEKAIEAESAHASALQVCTV